MTALGPLDPVYPHVRVKLAGLDGNVYFIIGRIADALRREVNDQAASIWTLEALEAGSYDGVLQLAMRTVDVS